MALLLLSISGICFTIAFVHSITKPIVDWLSRETAEEKQLIDEIKTLKEELEGIPMRQEYTKYVKVERKIVATRTKLTNLQNANQTKNLALRYGIPYGSQFVLSFTLLVISYIFRYTPIVVFNGKDYDFTPFTNLIKFPTGVDGAVSVPF